MTSNVGVSELASLGKSVGFQTLVSSVNDDARERSIIDKALKKKFKPEFLNRIDDAIVFNSLTEDAIHKIIYMELEKLEQRLGEVGYKFKISKPAVEFLAKEGYSKEYGARPLNRTIQRHIEDGVSDEILAGNVEDGDVIKIGFDKAKNVITLDIEKKSK